jgi:predicted 3-demethylubiquinone-9 3-methyltransferase (glyoxalase superfamily)
MQPVQKITPFLWFESNAHEAAKFYSSIFKPSKIISKSAMGATLDLRGQKLILFNGGPAHPLSPAVSMFVSCKTQKEVDSYWSKLLQGGKPSRCGWLTDKYGLSWQIVPDILGELLQNEDREKAQRVLKVMLGMVKLDIQQLKDAAGPSAKRKRKR